MALLDENIDDALSSGGKAAAKPFIVGFQWADKGYRWLDNVVTQAAKDITPDVVEKPVVSATKKSVSAIQDYLLKPVIRPALAVSMDAGTIFEYLLASNYEGLFQPSKARERARREGTFGLFTQLKDQLIFGQGTSDLGTGYIPGGEAFRRSQQQILEDRPRVGELPFTLGRAAAYPGVKLNIYNQDSVIYRAISGGVDMVKAVKNPVDPFNWITPLRPATLETSVATGRTKVVNKAEFAKAFDSLENDVLTVAEEISINPRPLTAAEQVKARQYGVLTQRTVPTLNRQVADPLLPGATKTVQSYEPGLVYEAWRPDVEAALESSLNNIGAVRDIAPTMIRNNYQRWRESGQGTAWAQELFDGIRSGELNAGSIWRTMLNREGPQTAALLVQEITNPNATVADVWRILDEALGSFEPGFNLRNIGRASFDAVRQGDGNVIRFGAQKAGEVIRGATEKVGVEGVGFRQFELLPESTRIGLTDVHQSARNLDNLMGAFGFDLATRDDFLSKFFVASSGTKDELFKFLSDFEYQAIGDKLRQITIPFTNRQVLPDDVIRELTSWTKKLADEIRLYTVDDLGNSVPLPWLDGDGIGPNRLTQLIGDDYFLMPPEMVNEMVRLTGVVGAFLKGAEQAPVVGRGVKLYDDAVRGMQNYMSNYWKPSRVAKPSHLIRVVPEEVLRGMASGVFEHPMEQMLAMVGGTLRRDAAGNVIKGKIPNVVKMHKKLDELENLLNELTQYKKAAAAGTALTKKQAKLVAREAEIVQDIADLSAKIDAEPQAIWDVLIGPRSRGAMASSTGEYAPVYSQLQRRGIMQIPDKNITVQRNAWVKGVTQELVDMAYNEDYRRIAALRLFDGDLVTINNVTADINTHIANGVIHPYTGLPLSNDIDAVKLWLFQGEGRQFFDRYFDNIAGLKPQYRAGGYDNYSVASERVDTILNYDIFWVTGFDQPLLDLIATGEYNGARAVFRQPTGRGLVSDDLTDYLRNTFIDAPHAPRKVKFFPQRMLAEPGVAPRRGLNPLNGLQRLYGFYFEQAYGRASDFFARSPTWKANYWSRMEELVPSMTLADAQKTVAAAKKARLTETRIERMEIAARLADGTGTLPGAEILAEQFATRATNDLLFNANKRSVFGAQHRLLFPFFEAFREVTGTWLRLAAMNPRIIRNVGSFVSDTESAGFVTTTEDGRKVFEIPMTGKVASSIIGYDKPIIRNFTVGTNAVNIALQLRPGVGPTIQYFVDDFAPATPDYDWLRSFVSPYGQASPVETFLPIPTQLGQVSQLAKLVPGLKDSEGVQQLLDWLSGSESNEYKQRALIRAHDYLLNTQPDVYQGVEGFSQAFDDAEQIANKVTAWRGIIAVFGPGAPLTTWVTETKQGSIDTAIVMDDLRRLEEEFRKQGRPSSDAFSAWIEFWGEDVWALTGTITKSNIGGQVASKEFNQWVSQNAELVDKYPLVAGYLGPRSGERSFEAWVQQTQAGRREIKDVVESSEESQQRFGNYLYYREKDKFSEEQLKTEEVRQYLANKLTEIEERLPLFAPPGEARLEVKQRNRRQIAQLRTLAEDPELQDSAVVQDLRTYFRVLDASIQNAIKANPTITVQNWRNARAARDLRRYIESSIAAPLIKNNPAFRDVYEQVLSYEFVLD